MTISATDIRELERGSIRDFVASCSEHLWGRVLDFGCGLSPYKDIVEAAGGTYTGFDRIDLPGNVSKADIGPPLSYDMWDAILCTQVLQYVPDVPRLLARFRWALALDGVLILTYPTNWDEVEDCDLHRFTKTGIAALLADAGFTVVRQEGRAAVELNGFRFSLGGGVVARI